MSTTAERKTISVVEFIDFVDVHIWRHYEDSKRNAAQLEYRSGPWFPMFVEQLKSNRKSICLNFPQFSELKFKKLMQIYGSIIEALKETGCKEASASREFTRNGYFLYIYDREEMLTRFK